MLHAAPVAAGAGVLGGIAAMKIAEAYDKEIEFTERGMITKLQETINKDRRKAGGLITTYSLN